MQSTVRFSVSIFLLTSALVSAYHNSAKLRRDGVLNLYPFPRVGRSGPQTWLSPVDEFHLGDDQFAEKRQMYAFPRVGRSDGLLRELFRSEQLREPPVRRTESTGMWFGPRLGRSVKNDEDTDMMPMRPHNGLGMWFGPRVGRAAKTADNVAVPKRVTRTPHICSLIRDVQPSQHHVSMLTWTRQKCPKNPLREVSLRKLGRYLEGKSDLLYYKPSPKQKYYTVKKKIKPRGYY